MDLLIFKKYCIIAFFLRIILVVYANFHDIYFNVPYTDIDYKVFTDAARHITEGDTPFKRHTYRYTPLLACFLIPNIYLHKDFGKILFSLVDIVVAVLIRRILTRQKWNNKVVTISVFLWLYNPLTVVISTRGNADSLAVLPVILTLDFLQTDQFFLAGLIHGFSVHFRLYPIIFSLAMFLSINKYNRFIPSLNQLKFVSGCAFSFLALTGFFYKLYGYEFLYESFLYHLIRRDAKHNFSVYFYMSYLSSEIEMNTIKKIFILLPQIMLLLSLSYKYSDKSNLPFALFTQAMVIVIYNSVMTSQYFFWFLSLLPLCLPNIKMSNGRSINLISIWILSQGLWLFFAYLLEFQGFNTFLFLWISGLLFFTTNVKILTDLIKCYKAS
ncbi:PREDICTED: GPI mannosyltransferase 1 [Polistes canadensis]|uniref:GPI mannosyltransferase 1 n=1 Tax=Polistes canadensis TaxID=91411 RepID=UPI000718F57C|nr:PREDICTED: GPI mannosyltransferase 1 [Polistes canadensis]